MSITKDRFVNLIIGEGLPTTDILHHTPPNSSSLAVWAIDSLSPQS